ncbi:MAG TPA: hypothetical protein VHX38_02615 [Pseudonocardiaceae bacterium]|nr:hypothetical protein [Pseudonocardiaceae bacterium]
MSAPTLYANTDLVAQAWLATVPGITADMVGAVLPAPAAWADKQGFVTARTVGGADNPDYQLNGPVVTVDVYSYSATSARPPWNAANNLASAIWLHAHDRSAPARDVTLSGSYPPARVSGAWVLSPPRRAYADAGDYAHFILDLQLKWVQL